MFRRLRYATLPIALLAALLVGTNSSAQSTDEMQLWIAYRLPDNPDLRAAATEILARALRDRNAENVICERSVDVTSCKRQAEKTFRTRLSAYDAITFGLYAGPRGGYKTYLFNLSADEAVNPNLDRLFVQTETGRYSPLGISVDRADPCRFVRKGTQQDAGFNYPVFVETACFMVNLSEEGVAHNPSGALPLAFVTIGGKVNESRAEFLLARGANPTPALHAYVTQNERATVDWVRRLFRSGAVAENVLGVSNPAIAELLLEHGAKVNARDPETGETALIGAACETELTQVLLRHHADVNVKDKHGNTALSWNLSLAKPSRRHPEGSPKCAAAASMLRAHGAH
jgi:hypothetical protein